MKNIKTILLVALMGVASYGSYTAYEAATMTDEERALMENVEALANNEDSGCSSSSKCFDSEGTHYGDVSCSGKECMTGYEMVMCDGIIHECTI